MSASRLLHLSIIALLLMLCNPNYAQRADIPVPVPDDVEEGPANPILKNAIKLDDLKKDLKALRNHEEMHFLYYRYDPNKQKQTLRGTFSMRTTWENQQIKMLEYYNFLEFDRYNGVHNTKTTQLDNRLSLIHAHHAHIRSMEFDDYTIQIKDGVETRKQNLQGAVPSQARWHKDAIVDFALFRVASQFPKKKGVVINLGKIARLSGYQTEFVSQAYAKCVGQVAIFRFEKKAVFTKFEVRGNSRTPNYGLDLFFNEKNQLMRIDVKHLNARFERMELPEENKDVI